MWWSYSTRTDIIVNCENESEAIATADDYPTDIVFEADLVNVDSETEPTRWWRVLDADGRLWTETSDEEEARRGFSELEMDSGRKLQRLYRSPKTLKQWRDVI